MIQSCVTIVAQAGQRGELQRALQAYVSPTRVEPGCLGCRLYEDVEHQDALTLIEEWDSAPDLERRLRSDEYRLLLQLMESSPLPPTIVFHFIEETKGLEVVREARLIAETDGTTPDMAVDNLLKQQPA